MRKDRRWVHDGRIMESSDALRSFRHSLYECLHRRGDALFELTDAILTADSAVPSPVHLSLQASHRRGWGSLYAALGRGRIDAEALRRLLACCPLAGSRTPVYAVDVSVWPRCDAECSPERGLYYHPSRHSAGQPIVAGWAYQFLPHSTSLRESWTAPVDVERVRPAQDANEVATEQVKALLRLPHRVRRRRGERRSAVRIRRWLRSGQGATRARRGVHARSSSVCGLVASTPIRVSLVRLPTPGGRVATDPRRSARIRAPGLEPSTGYTFEDSGYGTVRVRAWAKMHPKVCPQGPGSRGPLPIVVGTLVLVEAERLPRGERRREPRVCGYGGTARGERRTWTSLAAYVRRFDLEHTFRFLKQSMGWITPRGCDIPSRPTGGRGWWWPLSPNSGWRARALRT